MQKLVFWNRIMLLLAILVLLSCKKDDNPLSEVPEIDLVNIEPKVVKSEIEPFQITISFKDGNGDLGSDIVDTLTSNLFTTYTRIDQFGKEFQLTVPANLPVLTSDAKNPSIQGEIQIDYSPLIINPLYPSSLDSEIVKMELYIKDNAGNVSNSVNTQITVVRN